MKTVLVLLAIGIGFPIICVVLHYVIDWLADWPHV